MPVGEMRVIEMVPRRIAASGFTRANLAVGHLPVLQILLRRIAASGFKRANLAVGHLAELIEAYFGDGSRFGVELVYWRGAEPLGHAGPHDGMGMERERVR